MSCTSNTIFEKPKDLIPKDTMSLLLQEMVISVSAKFIKNKNDKTNINYMPFVFDKFKIDSTRFNTSNLYYMSTIDLYKEILEDAKSNLGSKNKELKKTKKRLDSIKRDSTDRVRKNKKRRDSLKNLGKINSLKLEKFKFDSLDSLLKTKPLKEKLSKKTKPQM